MIFLFLCLTYFTWCDNLQIQPCCYKWHYFIQTEEFGQPRELRKGLNRGRNQGSSEIQEAEVMGNPVLGDEPVLPLGVLVFRGPGSNFYRTRVLFTQFGTCAHIWLEVGSLAGQPHQACVLWMKQCLDGKQRRKDHARNVPLCIYSPGLSLETSRQALIGVNFKAALLDRIEVGNHRNSTRESTIGGKKQEAISEKSTIQGCM